MWVIILSFSMLRNEVGIENMSFLCTFISQKKNNFAKRASFLSSENSPPLGTLRYKVFNGDFKNLWNLLFFLFHQTTTLLVPFLKRYNTWGLWPPQPLAQENLRNLHKEVFRWGVLWWYLFWNGVKSVVNWKWENT